MRKMVVALEPVENLHDSFYLTQSLVKRQPKNKSHSPKATKESCLPSVHIRSQQNRLYTIDELSHLQRRKKRPMQAALKASRSIVLCKYIQGVSRQALSQSITLHQNRVSEVQQSIHTVAQDSRNVNEFLTNQKSQTKKALKDLSTLKTQSAYLDTRLQKLRSTKQQLLIKKEQLQYTHTQLQTYESFCIEALEGNSLVGEAMLQTLDKIEGDCLGQSQLIKLLHCSGSSIKKQCLVVKTRLEPKKRQLQEEAKQLKIRYAELQEETGFLKQQKLKWKNVTSVRHPYFVITPKIISAGTEQFMMALDIKDERSSFLVLKKLEQELEASLFSIKKLRRVKPQQLDKTEICMLKSRALEAHRQNTKGE